MEDGIVKICKNCGPIYSKNAVFRKNGRIECRICVNKSQKARRLRNLEKYRKRDNEWALIERDSHTTELTCVLCKITKPISDFFKSMFKIKRPRCKLCCSNASKKSNSKLTSKQRHKQRYNDYYKPIAQDKRLTKLYGITLKEYNEMLRQQNNSCAICGLNEDLHTTHTGRHKYFAVDHNHLTGAIRGLLCCMCNSGLGQFKDNAVYLENAAKYLSHYV